MLITPILVIAAIPLSFYYYILNTKTLEKLKNITLPLYNFLLNKWYIDELYDSLFIKPTKKIGFFFWKKGDIGTIDRFGPDGITFPSKMNASNGKIDIYVDTSIQGKETTKEMEKANLLRKMEK